jgi:ABC-type protease/lipase transport system fused ATPase/permease subunit
MKKLKRWGKKIKFIDWLTDIDKVGRVFLSIIGFVTLITITWLILYLFDIAKLTIVWGFLALVSLIMILNILVSYHNENMYKRK